MTKYRVYFNQINENYYDVEADDKEHAKFKARHLWDLDNWAEITSVEKN